MLLSFGNDEYCSVSFLQVPCLECDTLEVLELLGISEPETLWEHMLIQT
jgi:hypothetical protein